MCGRTRTREGAGLKRGETVPPGRRSGMRDPAPAHRLGTPGRREVRSRGGPPQGDRCGAPGRCAAGQPGWTGRFGGGLHRTACHGPLQRGRSAEVRHRRIRYTRCRRKPTGHVLNGIAGPTRNTACASRSRRGTSWCTRRTIRRTTTRGRPMCTGRRAARPYCCRTRVRVTASTGAVTAHATPWTTASGSGNPRAPGAAVPPPRGLMASVPRLRKPLRTGQVGAEVVSTGSGECRGWSFRAAGHRVPRGRHRSVRCSARPSGSRPA